MAGYQRILSYLYGYLDGQRQQCVGFVKIEKREDSLKVNVAVNDEQWKEQMSLKISLYKDRGNKISVQELGLVTMPKEREEISILIEDAMCASFDSELWDGVVIHDEKKIYYGSIWQGDELPLEKIVQAFGHSSEEAEQEILFEEKEVELEATEVKQPVHRSGTWRDYYDTRRKIYEGSHQAGKESIGNR